MIVVSNSSPLISLARIKEFYLLKELFREIVIPKNVYDEVVIKGKGQAGSNEVYNAKWITQKEVTDLIHIRRFQKTHNIGAGEAATIVLAKEIKANVTIMDERRARILAESENLSVIGTLGLLELSFEKNLIPSLYEVYQRLKNENIRIDTHLINDSLKKFEPHKL